MCTHDWKPVAGWYARYRCAICGGFGYKQRFIRTDELGPGGPPKTMGSDRIKPYLCAHKPGGASCGGFAVKKENGRWKCAEHRHEKLVAKAAAPSGSQGTHTRRARSLVSEPAPLQGETPHEHFTRV
jgi:hypothetical protein